jgi:hypothetical protein
MDWWVAPANTGGQSAVSHHLFFFFVSMIALYAIGQYSALA